MLACFATLTDCRLNAPGHENLSVQPLQALPRLTRLEVWDGVFVGLEVLEHLTSLKVMRAQVECYEDSRWVTCPVELCLTGAQLTSFHSGGLGACTGLVDLTFVGSSMLADNADVDIQCLDQVQVATNLTALTYLHFGMWCRSAHVQLEWLARLASLQKFSLDFELNEDHSLVFPTTVSRLSYLTKLNICGRCGYGNIQLNFDWAKFCSLASVCLQGQFSFAEGLGGLRDLKPLSRLDFEQLFLSDPDSTQQVADVIQQLIQSRPAINVSTNKTLKLHMQVSEHF